MRFLIVDDSKVMQSIMAKAMNSIGYTKDHYDYASDGAEALAIIKATPPDLVLSDLHMPNMSGIELIQAIKHEQLDVPIGIISIDNDKQLIDQAKAAGAAFYLHKPFSSQQLALVMVEILGMEHMEKDRERKTQQEVIFPTQRVLEVVLSSLGRCDVTVKEQDKEQFHPWALPVITGSLVDQHEQVKAYVIFDRMAINAISTFMNYCTEKEALTLTAEHQVSDKGIEAIESFMGLLSVLLHSPNKDNTFKVHAAHQWDSFPEKIKKFIAHRKDYVTTMSFSSPAFEEGHIVFDPANNVT